MQPGARIISCKVISFLANTLFLSLMFGQVSAQVTDVPERTRLEAVADWQALCEITDCDQFPIGYATYAIGGDVFYFPQYDTMTEKPPDVLAGGVKTGQFFEVGAGDRLLRSFSAAPRLTISNCCHHLLAHYGLAEGFPEFGMPREGNRMPPAATILSAHDRPHPDNSAQRRFAAASDEVPSIGAVIGDNQLSFNDDFWLLSVDAPNAQDVRRFRVLSKHPLLNDRHVFGDCDTSCTFSTLSFADDAQNGRAHVSLRWMTLTREQMFLCAGAEHETGCDAAPDVFDQVPAMLKTIDDMLDAARQFPEK